MSKSKIVRSPLFYVGDKHKLMSQLLQLFPKDISSFYDVFCGGGSVSLNTSAKMYYLNDINKYIIELHELLLKNANNMEDFIIKEKNIAKNYGLSISEDHKYPEIEELKTRYKKTYFSEYNKKAYLKMREDYNRDKKNVDILYLLVIFGFNRMIRFNKSGFFNVPVGNVDWNSNVTKALIDYGKWATVNNRNITISSMDFERFVKSYKIQENDFLYFDPPYLITSSEYNKIWTMEDEIRLYKLLDELNQDGIKWGLSNMVMHKSKTNDLLIEWSKKYYVYDIKSNYISRFDNHIKSSSKEIYVTNHQTDRKL